MPPEPELIATKGVLQKTQGLLEGINLPDLLDTINNRVEKLLDKDHLKPASPKKQASNPVF